METDSLEIRFLSAADLGVLDRVDPDVFDNPVRRELAAEYLASTANLLVVAIASGTVVGMASAIAYVHPDKPRQLFINEVGVSQGVQRRGLATRLMRALLERGRAMGCVEAWVATEVGNKPARALYGSLHGKEDPEQAVVYTWDLSRAGAPERCPPPMRAHLRIARPVSDLPRSVHMYMHGLSLRELGRFADHEGFDGVMLGDPGSGFHFEFTVCRHHPVSPSPTPEDLLVFYVPDPQDWDARCRAMLEAGFEEVESFNPYWSRLGRTFADHDGYRVVIQRAGAFGHS